ncbi:SHOCT domain-containing protein [Haliovirga abyssi]|uniref:SHOCT domain-containing protein n=1 Tax=Haliovirga abyssi TaxID=2996794 RepID=A0AAU9DUN6_9FUSO|nr:SHOCT domain-containing protein [Haliovirga abyssi]BDU49711.1 hypothetical protein HLVA_02800 [Haliovirga abyssi]
MKIRMFIGALFILAIGAIAYANVGNFRGGMMGGGIQCNGVYNNTNVNSEESKVVDEFVKKLKGKYKVGESEKLNPDKLTGKELEELGDLVMDVMIPNKYQHETMDNMMGGEGSSRLTAVHQNIAYNYLRGNGFAGMGMMGMMGNGMMGNWNNSYNSNNSNNLNRLNNSNRGQESALEILQRRYANGEITKEQYEDMKKVLNKK